MIFFTSSLSRRIHLYKGGEDKSKFSVHIVGDGVLDVPRVKLQCRFCNGRGELCSPAQICTMSQH